MTTEVRGQVVISSLACLATIAASVAAAASVYAAFRQEHAVYSSQLLMTQVTQLGSFETARKKADDSFEFNGNRLLHIATTAGGTGKRSSQQYKEANAAFAAGPDGLRTATDQAELVLPRGMAIAIDRIGELENERVWWNSNTISECYASNCNLSAKYPDLVPVSNAGTNDLVKLDHEVTDCAHMVFLKGQALDEQTIKSCNLSVPADPFEGANPEGLPTGAVSKRPG
jgi:hypothetical protein